MKNRIILSCLIALFSVPQLLAQHVSVKNDMIDVGQIKFQNAASADFEIKNVSNKAIYIRELLTSCGCVVGDYPQEIIRRDSSFVVRLTYDAMQLGHFEKYASIYFNDDTEPTILTLKGVVVEEIVNFEGNYPYKLGELFVDKVNIEFDDVSRGERPFAEIHVKNPTSNTVQPVVMHLPNFLTADMSPSKIPSGHAGKLTITLNSALLRDYGLAQTSVFLGKVSGERVSPDKEITVSAILLPDFNDLTDLQRLNGPRMKLSTVSLDLGSFNGKKKAKGDLFITNVGRSRLTISALQMYTVGLQVSMDKTSVEPGETLRLRVTASAKDLKFARSKPRILMITNDPEKPKVTIDVNVKN